MNVNKNMVECYLSLDRADIAAFDTPTLHDVLESLCVSWLQLNAENSRLQKRIDRLAEIRHTLEVSDE